LLSLNLVSCLDKIPLIGNDDFCPYTRLEDGNCPGVSNTNTIKVSWDFTDSLAYSFDSNVVDLSSGRAALKELDTTYKGSDFLEGSYLATKYSNELIQMRVDTDATHVNTILPGKSEDLRAYWRFEGDLKDEKGIRNGTSGAPPSYAQGKVGQAASLNSSSYVELESSASRLLNYTISFWYYPGESGTLLHRGRSNGGCHYNPKLTYNDASGKLSFSSSGCSGSGNHGEVNLTRDRWNHIVVTRTDSPATKQTLYLNGVEVLSGSVETNNYGSLKFLLGSNYASSKYPDEMPGGFIDELAVWNLALTEEETLEIYEAQSVFYAEETGLSHAWTPHWNDIEGYWKLDGNYGDSSGKRKHASSSGGVSFTSTSKVGGQAAIFNGVDGKIEPEALDITAWTQLSTCAWYNSSASLINYNRLLSLSHSGGDDLRIYFQNGILHFSVDDGTAYTINDSVISNDGNWHHVCGTFDGSKLSLYRNSLLIDTIPASFNFSSANGDVVIGKKFGGSNFFDGYADDVSIFKVSLTNADITRIYNNQKQKYGANYESPVIDLKSTRNLLSFSGVTDLAYMKELTERSEDITSYSAMSGDLTTDLIAYWPMNEASWSGIKDEIRDQSGNANHAYRTGSVSTQSNGILNRSSGNFGSAANDSIITVSSDVFVPSDNHPISASVWIQPTKIVSTTNTNISNRIITIHKASSAASSFVLGLGNTDKLMVYNDKTSSFFESTNSIALHEWTHVAMVYNGSCFQLFINGNPDGSCHGGGLGVGGSFPMRIGSYDSISYAFKGSIDEVAVWGRAISNNEVKDLYRRAANRIRYQLRVCSDETCSLSPEWKGPGGDGTTYFSELYNRSSANLSSMFTSCGSGGDKICSSQEIYLEGQVMEGGNKFKFTDSLLNNYTPVQARYFQYRVLLEAEENTSCSSEACLPSLSTVIFEASNKYYDVSPSVTANSSVTVTDEIVKVEETVVGSCSVKYQFSKDGVSFYYYSAGTWVAASDDASQANTVSQISSNLKDFISQGPLYMRAYLTGNNGQSCELHEFSITQEGEES